MPMFKRSPRKAKTLMWVFLLSAFAAPFGIIQYQLSVHVLTS
jgi:hypothetical protein